MSALSQLTDTLRALPLDDAGRESVEKLCRDAEAEQWEFVDALRQARVFVTDEWDNSPGTSGGGKCLATITALLSRFPKG